MKKEIIVIKNGKDYNITHTNLIQSYFDENYIPEVDKLLDWRLKLMGYQKECGYENGIITLEILATDYLLNEKQK